MLIAIISTDWRTYSWSRVKASDVQVRMRSKSKTTFLREDLIAAYKSARTTLESL